MSNHAAERPQGHLIETEVLIVGAGPAGASLACFLAAHGVKGIIVSKDSTGAAMPHSHITNMATFECFRDIGLEDVLKNVSTPLDETNHLLRWSLSMAGRELARRPTFHSTPQRMGEYKMASPCEHSDLAQTKLEPELIRYATLNGFQVRWDTEFSSLTQKDSSVTVELRDKVTRQTYSISAKYVFGADGAESQVMEQLDQVQMTEIAAPEWADWAVDVSVKADLSHLMKSRPAVLNWVLQITRDHALFNMACIVRMVKQWNEWVFSFIPVPGIKEQEITNEQFLDEIRHIIGDQTAVEITSVSKWRMTGAYADNYSAGRVFCLGDAVHFHPPVMGLGSNNSIQDAYNLAWKVAYVLQNKASPLLLNSYSIERQPVGRDIVTRINEALNRHVPLFESIFDSPSLSRRMEVLALLDEATEAGEKLRVELQASIDACAETEVNGLGIEFNQDYSVSPAIVNDISDGAPTKSVLEGNQDPVRFHTRTTVPGWRLPHVWLNTAVPSRDVSTIDLAGKGKFTILTGIGGGAWKEAGVQVSAELGVPIQSVSIGYGQGYEDLYGDWARIRGVESSGVLLVRPDNFVAWRHHRAEGDGVWAADNLRRVMRKILALDN